MKFKVSSSELLKSLQIASGVIAPSPVLPVTEDFYFSSRATHWPFRGYQCGKHGNYQDGGQWYGERRNCHFSQDVAWNPKKHCQISQLLLVTLKTAIPMPSRLYPATVNTIWWATIRMISRLSAKTMPWKPFHLSVKTVDSSGQKCICRSNDEMRLAMTGVYMMIDYNKVVFVATDAHKLVKYTLVMWIPKFSDSIILSRKLISLLKAALPGHGSVDISFNRKNAVFQFGDTKSS